MNRLLVLIVGLLLSLFARAADTIQEQGYLLHYSAINTLSLTEDIARQFGIKRRKSHAIFLLSPKAQNEIQNGEKLAFDVSVKPEGAVRPISIRFLQQFYRD